MLSLSRCLIFLLFFLFPAFLYGQELVRQYEASDILNDQEIFGRFFFCDVFNDFVFGVQHANDTGYTTGLFFGVRIPQRSKYRYFDIYMSSQLYTKQAAPLYKDVQDRIILPQFFTEISFFHVAFSQYYPKINMMLRIQAGGGIYNEKQAIPGLMLYMQGGIDGHGGFHALNPTPIAQNNIAKGDIRVDFYGQGSLQKHYMIKRKKGIEPIRFNLESGLRIGYPFLQSSQLFLQANISVPVFQLDRIKKKPKYKTKFRLGFYSSNRLSFHSDGGLYAPEVGVKIDLFFIQLMIGNIFLMGKQQDAYTQYNDKEPLLRIRGRVYF